MTQKISFGELNLSNAFLFAAVMENEELCRQMLEVILRIKIARVHVHTEKPILINSNCRGVRLDVLADDENHTMYNVEMQNAREGNLPQRSRYYQGKMDVKTLKPGEDFRNLKNCYVIFICTFDPFKQRKYCYTFEERCIESDFPLGDGTKKIFLNTRGENDKEVPKELIEFLKYVEHSTMENVRNNPFVEQLHEEVQMIKRNGELEEGYMLLGEMIDQAEAKARAIGMAEGKVKGMTEGRAEGRAEGETRAFSLIAKLQELGLPVDICRLQNDKEYLEELYLKYQIK